MSAARRDSVEQEPDPQCLEQAPRLGESLALAHQPGRFTVGRSLGVSTMAALLQRINTLLQIQDLSFEQVDEHLRLRHVTGVGRTCPRHPSAVNLSVR